MTDEDLHVEIDYTNWRGERRVRRVRPISIDFTSSTWHPKRQWLLIAVDPDSGDVKSFPLVNIHSWKGPSL